MNLIFVVVSLVIVMSVVHVSQSQAPSKNLLNFVSMLSGNFTNKKQVAREMTDKDKSEEHDLIATLWQPVYIPSLSPAITIYHEEIDNNKVFRSQVWVFSEVDNVIHIQPYNVSGLGSYKPGELAHQADWSSVSLEESKDICEILFRPVETEVYMGTIPDCSRELRGPQLLPYYAFTVTCSAASAMVYFESSRETVSKLPYIFRIQNRIPLPDYVTEKVNDFIPPCGYN